MPAKLWLSLALLVLLGMTLSSFVWLILSTVPLLVTHELTGMLFRALLVLVSLVLIATSTPVVVDMSLALGSALRISR
jgi:uncharacterized membrane protein